MIGVNLAWLYHCFWYWKPSPPREKGNYKVIWKYLMTGTFLHFVGLVSSWAEVIVLVHRPHATGTDCVPCCLLLASFLGWVSSWPLRSLSWCGRSKGRRGRTDIRQLIWSPIPACNDLNPFIQCALLRDTLRKKWDCFYQSSKSDSLHFRKYFAIFFSRLCFVKLKLLLLAIEVGEIMNNSNNQKAIMAK